MINPTTLAPEASQPKAPDTTHQEDLTTAGQRTINLIWEHTQSKIALFVIIAGMLVNCISVLIMLIFKHEITVVQVALISLCLQFVNLTCGIVIGFYFGRTNHTAIGGIGKKPAQGEYTGR